MNIDGILDGKITIEGQELPTVREILEQHFVASAGGNPALGKMVTAQYVAYLTDMVEGSAAREKAAGTTARPDASQDGKTVGADQPREGAGFRVGPDAEALLKSMGVPLTVDGRIDLMSTLAGVLTPEGSKTPLGTLFGTVLRGIGEPPRPRG